MIKKLEQILMALFHNKSSKIVGNITLKGYIVAL